MNINFGIVAIDKKDKSKIIHFVGFSNIPTMYDFIGIQEELETDITLGLTDEDYFLALADEETVRYFSRIIKGAN